jgi:hypothetical protein
MTINFDLTPHLTAIAKTLPADFLSCKGLRHTRVGVVLKNRPSSSFGAKRYA